MSVPVTHLLLVLCITPPGLPQSSEPLTIDATQLAGRWLLTMPSGFLWDATLEPAGEAGLVRLQTPATNLRGLYELRGRKLVLVQPDNPRMAGIVWELRGPNGLVLTEHPERAHVGSNYTGATLQRLGTTGLADAPPPARSTGGRRAATRQR